jgi:cytochrome c biogenesis factor
MPGIAAAIISGIVGIVTSHISGQQQEKILESGQEEARLLNERQMTEARSARLANERLSKSQLRLQSKQLAENTRLSEARLALNKEALGLEREGIARTSLRDQYSRLTSILEGNEQLKSLYINRLKGLRN